MPRRKIDTDVFHCHVPAGDRETLARIAIALGYTYGDGPYFSGFLHAIATGEILLVKQAGKGGDSKL
jgi:hypothetical protein